MVQITISSPDRKLRSIDITTDSIIVGSSMECDVILFDTGVEPKHISLVIEEDTLTVQALTGAGCIIHRGKNTRRINEAEKTEWSLGDVLQVGTAFIDLSGAGTKVRTGGRTAAPVQGRIFAFLGRSRARAVPTVSISLVVLALAGIIFPIVGSARFFESDVVVGPIENISLNEGELRAQLENLGMSIKGYDVDDGTHSIVGYVDTPATASEVQRFHQALPKDVLIKIYVDTRLHAAVDNVIRNLDFNTHALNVENGTVKLAALLNPLVEEELKNSILSDVPGLSHVEFAEIDQLQTNNIFKTEISGIWSGARPYLLLADGQVIRPDAEIANGVFLKSIDSNQEILLESNGLTWSYIWNE